MTFGSPVACGLLTALPLLTQGRILHYIFTGVPNGVAWRFYGWDDTTPTTAAHLPPYLDGRRCAQFHDVSDDDDW